MNFKSLIYVCLVSILSGCALQGPANVSPDKGAAKSAAPSAVIRVSSAGTDAAEPAVAGDADGSINVLYVEHGAGKAADVYLQKFDSGLKASGERVRVNPEPGTAAAWRGDQPTIKTGKNGNVYIGWNRKIKTDGTPGNDLVLSVSSDGGKSFAEPVRVNDDTIPASHGMSAMALYEEKVYFAWLDERYLKKEQSGPAPKTGGDTEHSHAEPNAELYFAVSNDDGKTFLPNKKVAGDICPCCKVEMAAAGGKLHISWRQVLPGDMRHIAVASSADNGETFGQTTIVSDDKWHINACPVSGAPLAAGENDTLKVAWYTAGEAGAAGLYWAESKDSGMTFSPRVLLSEGVIMGTTVMLSDGRGGSRLIWNANGKLFTENLSAEKTAGAVQEIGEGEFPAAALAKNGLYISYVKNENGKRSVWLQGINN